MLAGQRRGLFARLVVNGFAQAGAGLLSAHLTMHAFGLMADGAELRYTGLGVVAAALCAAALVLAWLRCRERVDAERMGQGYARELRSALFDQLGRLSVRSLQRRRRGSLMLRFIGDLKSFRQWVSLGFARMTVAGVSTAAALLGLAVIDAALSAAALVVLLAGGLVTFRLGLRTHDSIRAARRRQTRLAANLGEKLASMAVVQLFGQIRRERLRLERQGERLAVAMVEQARAQARLRSSAETSAHFMAVAVLIVGVVQVAWGTAGAPQVVAAMTLVGIMVPALRDLGVVHSYYAAARVSRERIEAFLAQPVLGDGVSTSLELIPSRGSISFRNVSLKDALRGFSAEAEGGKITAIVGPNGAGKSTLLALVARLLDPDDGAVLIDGQELASVSIESVRRAVGMVGSDLPLLRGSVERNLRYRWPNAPEGEVQRVRSLCGLEEIEATLRLVARCEVREGGSNLSPGTRQRIVLARALLGRPAVLLLDEADGNLDGGSRRILDEVLCDHEGTVLMVTHRIDVAERADVLWVIERGQLAAAGRPDELLRRPEVRAMLTSERSLRAAA